MSEIDPRFDTTQYANNWQKTLNYLDPNHGPRLRHQFDTQMGYLEQHRFAMEKYCRNDDAQFGDFDRVPSLNPDACEEIVDLIKNENELLEDYSFRMGLCEELLGHTELDKKIRAYFKSEYFVLFMRFYENLPSVTERNPAFFWHCDGGPSRHLKILLYLREANGEDGTTQILDMDGSRNFEKIGYTFMPLQHRLTDIVPLGDFYQLKYNLLQYQCDPGDALLFQPANTLHKGIWPKRNPRYMIQLCFVPSIKNWYQVATEHHRPMKENSWIDFSQTRF